MLKKLNLSYKGTIFTYAWFLFTIYCSYLILSSNGIKTISLKIGNVGFGILFNETFVAIMLLVIYLLFSMIPSRRGMLLPNIFLMFSVGQSVFIASVHWLGLIF
ncbi:hypothetical protein [Apilactobacillus ozensis]|uniref:hypothetical protein n=1 Tax=Apilactobacillus ozensis TaxID=866801 RepID=UPI0006D0CAEB|nr:hypothetical protein [Apilactobacillus ozensis]